MNLTGTRVVPAPVERVWRALHDPDTIRFCMPGCDALDPDGAGAYRVTVTAKVGPISARFTGRMRIADVDPLRAYTLRFDGAGGAAGFVNGEARVTLTSDADGGTTLTYVAKAQVGGKLAQIGSRLIDGAAQKLTDEFFTELVAATLPQTEERVAAVPTKQWVRPLAVAAAALVIFVALAALYLRG
jgi:carbon monoxide dehydrogenase subunit G